MTETLQGIAPISHLGIIRVQGDDAASFLHGQLTNDFVLLDQQHARLAAFCSAKGRMQASFIGFKRAPDDILLICSQDLLTRTLKRLSMFVLRAKAKLTDASADFQLFGLIGNAVPATEAPWTLHTQADGSHLVHLYPAAGQPRALLVAPVGTPAPQGTVLTPEQWLWTEVASGIAMVSEPVFELFVPQMLNYESVGGVNFKKGCYPGQEVFAASDAEQATGTVVQAAPAPQGGWDAIVSMQIQSAQEALTAGSPEGVALTVQSLPYALLEDI